VRHFDAIVVGAGAMGTAVSYNLSLHGMKVLTLERFGLNHGFGSSHGKTRIIRLAYFEDERYVPMLKRAFEAWRELEEKSGRRLLRQTGGLMIGRPEGVLVAGVLRSARKHGLPHRVLSARDAMGEFEALVMDEGVEAVHEANAGVLFPEECISAAATLGAEEGAELHDFERVARWKRAGGGYEVESDKGIYHADRLVMCAGPWTSQLIGPLIPLSCERQVPLWFPSLGEGCFQAGRLPVFVMEESPTAYFYGIPDFGDGVKVAVHHRGKTVAPDRVDREVTEEDIAPVSSFIERRLPGLHRVPCDASTCVYTNTPDMNFVIGPHPAEEKVMIVSACSGHGFKFASVLGEAVADLVTRGRTEYDLSFLGVDRFTSR
jgi:sarcosine oxidase